MNLGNYIRQARCAKGWTLEQLAREAGTTKSHIWDIEHNRSGLGLTIASRIAIGLSLSLTYMGRLIIEHPPEIRAAARGQGSDLAAREAHESQPEPRHGAAPGHLWSNLSP